MHNCWKDAENAPLISANVNCSCRLFAVWRRTEWRGGKLWWKKGQVRISDSKQMKLSKLIVLQSALVAYWQVEGYGMYRCDGVEVANAISSVTLGHSVAWAFKSSSLSICHHGNAENKCVPSSLRTVVCKCWQRVYWVVYGAGIIHLYQNHK
ncbi:unnamed protein product [Thelazia callipaeda]|uniref:Ig-like domain-containing protein n=1 Tax=Thelazia callipaeda TaxID=103827 RepID=A0A0N5CTS9_THECL|nr:unnamed protein product [Thelazia callipaeda]